MSRFAEAKGIVAMVATNIICMGDSRIILLFLFL